MESHPLRAHPQSHLVLSNIFSTMLTCFWLVVVCAILNRHPSKDRCIFISSFFWINQFDNRSERIHPPICSNPVAKDKKSVLW